MTDWLQTTEASRVSRVSDLLSTVQTRLAERFESMVRLSPRNQPYASDADPDSCLRRQVLEITHWSDKNPIPADRQGRLEAGIEAENKAIRLLKEIQLEVVKEQMPFELKHRRTGAPCLRGRVDGFLRWEGEEIPLEVKSLHPHVFSRIDSIADLQRFWWTQRYTFQLQAYMIGYGQPLALLLLTNLLGEWKILVIALDYDVAERIWAFAEGTLDAVDAYRSSGGTLPPYAKDPTECARCPFLGRTCNPPIQELGATLLDDPELLADLERWHETREVAKEHEGIDKRVKGVIKAAGIERALAGDYAISVKERPVKAYEVAARVDRVVTIEHLGSGK
jgi:hypothetical protein